MISFAVITDTPIRLRDFLIARGIIEQYTDPDTGQAALRGFRPGMEFVRVPNPIVTDPGPPPVYDTRAVFLVKFAWESQDEKEPAFRQWILDNSSVVNAPANYTINGVHVGSARKITNQNVWLVHIDPDRFGVWQ